MPHLRIFSDFYRQGDYLFFAAWNVGGFEVIKFRLSTETFIIMTSSISKYNNEEVFSAFQQAGKFTLLWMRWNRQWFRAPINDSQIEGTNGVSLDLGRPYMLLNPFLKPFVLHNQLYVLTNTQVCRYIKKNDIEISHQKLLKCDYLIDSAAYVIGSCNNILILSTRDALVTLNERNVTPF